MVSYFGILQYLVFVILWFIGIVFSFQSCLKADKYDMDARRNFKVLWEEVDKKYSLFARKNIDWAQIKTCYEPLLNSKTDQGFLFEVLRQVLSELHDGHVNLSTPTNVFSYKDFYLNYPVNFDPILVKRIYLGRDERVFGGVFRTRVLRANDIVPNPEILYIRYASFTSSIHASTLSSILAYIKLLNIKGIIIDIRSNTGGNLDNAQTLAGFLHSEDFVAGYIKFKTGPGHNDFSDFAQINAKSKVHLNGLPVVILTDRLVYSAANFFAAAVKDLPNVILLGDTTGGGGGMPYSNQLPNGWNFSISVNELFDKDKQPLEYGVAPNVIARFRYDDMKDNLIDTSYLILSRQIR